jgi:uncharacterized membrane protein
MTERALRIASVALALAGAAVSGYVLSVRLSGSTIACSTGGCATVQSSRYSEVLGLPVAALGLVGFLVMAGAAVARGELARLVQASVALAATAFSAYLLFLQLHVIGAVCDWCVASDVLTTGLAALALLRLRAGWEEELPRPRRSPAPRPLRPSRRTG